MKRHGGFVVSLPGQKGVKALGEELAPDYGVSFALPLVHTSGEQLAQIARLADADHLKTYIPEKIQNCIVSL